MALLTRGKSPIRKYVALGGVLAACGALTIGIAAAQEANPAAQKCLEEFVSGTQTFQVKPASNTGRGEQPGTQAPQPEQSTGQPDTQAPQPEQSTGQPDTQAPQPDQGTGQPDTQQPQPSTGGATTGGATTGGATTGSTDTPYTQNSGSVARYLSADPSASAQDVQQPDQSIDQPDAQQPDAQQPDAQQQADESDCSQIIADEADKAKKAFDPDREHFDNGKGELLRYSQTFPADAAKAPDNAEQILGQDFDAVQQVVRNRKEKLGRAPRGQFSNTCRLSHRNTDNSFVAPGVIDGAQHVHDYYGNETQNAFSNARNLLADDRSEECRQPRDISTYVWPGITTGGDTNDIVDPGSVRFQFRGYGTDVGQVVPMPRGLVVVAGAAKNLDVAKSNAKFACTGSENKTSPNFPTCTGGSRMVRIADMPSCWNGKDLDSPDHKTHVVFTRADGTCPESNPVPLPRLRMRAVYPISGDPGTFFLSSFPESVGLPVSDHADFMNMIPSGIMRRGVACINRGENCGTMR